MRYMLFAWEKGNPRGGMDDRVGSAQTLTELFSNLKKNQSIDFEWHVYDSKENMMMIMPSAQSHEILDWAAWKDGQNES
jgi:hypothetical protein